MRTHACAAVVAALLGTGCASLVTRPVPDDLPPVPRREFRGLWVTTVGNTDWPSVPGLDAEAHRAELRVVFDRAAALGFNAVVLQVRSAGDAIYPSGLEPWARVLTGRQGQDPGWDPLAFAVAEAHARGLELHAWFNPFRAGRVADSALLAPTHLWRARPDLARLAHGQLWFDPGEPEVRAHALRVIADVVTRYDIDGVHLDDYFYPYPTSAERPVGFPDDASYARWLAGGGTPMARGDWRRQNVDRFVEALFAEVRRVRPTVKVGISPFGIWRPGHPPGVKGLDAYADIYADARQWLARGWVDYFAPQLYWPIASPGQPFVPLLAWWQGVNTSRVHLWPGLPGYRVGDGTATGLPASEIGAQIDSMRARAMAPGQGSAGHLVFNAATVRTNRAGLGDVMASRYAAAAVIPATPWMSGTTPAPPTVDLVRSADGALRLTLAPAAGPAVRWWLVQWRTRGGWSQRLVWGGERQVRLAHDETAGPITGLAVSSLDAAMRASPPTVVSGWRCCPAGDASRASSR